MTLLVFAVLAVTLTCDLPVTFAGDSSFRAPVAKGKIFDGRITTASGMAASRVHEGMVWVHNDGTANNGNTLIYAVNITTGMTEYTYIVHGHGVFDYDWEDIAVGPCVDDCLRGHGGKCDPSQGVQQHCLYIGEIGGHGGDGGKNAVYMVREPPTLGVTTGPRHQLILEIVKRVEFAWSENDAETILVHPRGNVYVVSKRKDYSSKIAELPLDKWHDADDATHSVVNLDSSSEYVRWYSGEENPQGGDISPIGTEMVMVAEDAIWYWSIPDGDVMKAIKSTNPTQLSTYHRVPNTEAIAWAADGSGFYTLAEGKGQTIQFYSRVLVGGPGSTCNNDYDCGSGACCALHDKCVVYTPMSAPCTTRYMQPQQCGCFPGFQCVGHFGDNGNRGLAMAQACEARPHLYRYDPHVVGPLLG